jgi:hypothetical protein
MSGAADHHRSVLRELMAKASGRFYVAFETLNQVRTDPEGAVILEGDDGGQILCGCAGPAGRVLGGALTWLLYDLDQISWPGNDEGSARVVFERVAVGTGVAGGMGGGVVTSSAWIHPELVRLGIDNEIRAVLRGDLDRLHAQSRAKRRP